VVLSRQELSQCQSRLGHRVGHCFDRDISGDGMCATDIDDLWARFQPSRQFAHQDVLQLIQGSVPGKRCCGI
jgi:hypothetical protein